MIGLVSLTFFIAAKAAIHLLAGSSVPGASQAATGVQTVLSAAAAA